MQYLFFDIECIDSVHLCEFGYVLTDDRFLEIERDNILVSPEDYSYVWELLSYPVEEYLSAPPFPKVYERIRSLLEAEDRLAIGYATSNDVAFLGTACRKYDLPTLVFPYADAQVLYGISIGKPRGLLSLDKAAEDLALSFSGTLHRAVDDAYLTMKVFRHVVRSSKKTLETLRAERPQAFKTTATFHYSYSGSDLSEGLRLFLKDPTCLTASKKEALVTEYLSAMRPADPTGLPLAGEVFLFEDEFERNHFRDLLVYLDRLLLQGGSYTKSTKKKFTVYVTDRTGPLKDNATDCFSRYAKAKSLAASGLVRMITFAELRETLSLTAEEMPTASVRPLPNVAEEIKTFAKDKTDVKNTAGAVLRSRINYDALPDE